MPVVHSHATHPHTRLISAETFAAVLDAHGLPPGSHIAVAVSGGADSMALALLADSWAGANGCTLTALTVDHCLRDDSTSETEHVAAWLQSRGIAHHILTWGEGATVRHLGRSAQEAARDARYDLLTTWCRGNGCSYLMLAHHADDQIETFFMRLARGSGVQGLGGMDAKTMMRGVTVLRPVLGFTKVDLIGTCQHHGQAWIDDPSNQNSKYARSRFRQARAFLGAEGLTDERVLATISHMQRARDAISNAVAALQEQACIWSDYGTATLSASRFFAAPDEVSLRFLSDVLTTVGGQIYGPRFESLDRVHAKLKSSPMKAVTLHGCCVLRAGDAIMVMREPSAIREELSLPSNGMVLWDGRFEITLNNEADTGLSEFKIRPFQSEDRAWLKDQGQARILEDLPARVRLGLPMIVDDKGVAGMPHAGLWRSDAILLKNLVTVRFVAISQQSLR